MSVRQPWADMILFAGKNVENRTWRLPLRYVDQFVFLHAGLRHDPNGGPAVAPSRYGAILGIVAFSGCVTESDSAWFAGPYGWVISHAVPMEPVPCKGRLGFFPVDALLMDLGRI